MNEYLLAALQRALLPQSLVAMTFGVTAGIIIGALPGLTATMGVALLIPITFGMDPVAGLLMLTAVYGGAIYGGSISAILMHTPGTPASAATALDGYEMTKQGKAGLAIGISVIASSIGGIISVLALLLLAPPLSRLSLRFGPPEYFLLAVFGLTIIGSITAKSLIKGLIGAVFGLLLATVGIDVLTGAFRYTFGITALESGVSLVPAMIGFFSLSQVLMLTEETKESIVSLPDLGKERILPTLEELRSLLGTILYCSVLGTFVGILPGAGGDIASWVGYNEAKRISKHPEKFGTGYIYGVAAAESANNAVTGGAMVPLLTLGIPGSATAAVLLGGLLIQGLVPGRDLFTKYADVTYAVIVGMFITNILILIIGLVSARYAMYIAGIPINILIPLIVALCVIGSYAINNSMFDVWIMLVFGLIGFLMRKQGFHPAPVVLALILGPMAEMGLRQSLVISKGAILPYFLGRPISLILVVLIIASIVSTIILERRHPERVLVEE
ncbi:MAG: tripartite tricarboxylate transporter permease [Limnochordia bacterium]|jgi:putative tricarboxylic transport membrane protein